MFLEYKIALFILITVLSISYLIYKIKTEKIKKSDFVYFILLFCFMVGTFIISSNYNKTSNEDLKAKNILNQKKYDEEKEKNFKEEILKRKNEQINREVLELLRKEKEEKRQKDLEKEIFDSVNDLSNSINKGIK